MKLEKLFLAVLFLSASAPGFATRWSGGGGELIKDSRNPWWLENTKTVSYCIKVDREGNFEYSPSIGSLSKLVQSTLEYWKGQFELVQKVARGLDMLVATQEFVETTCNAPHDLTFQFGVLDPAQIEQLNSMGTRPKDHVSMAVRTDYDTTNLRGQGFVYIAPFKGKLKPDMEEASSAPWKTGNGGNLVYVLAHELGHVFGISHSESFMAEDFPEQAITSVKGRLIEHNKPMLGYLMPTGTSPATTFYCGPNNDLWGADVPVDCVSTVYMGGKRIEVRGVKSRSDLRNPFLIGTIECEKCSLHYAVAFGTDVKVWLPPEQIVFPNPEQRILRGASPMIYEGKATYRNLSGTVIKRLHVKIFPDDGREIFGTVNGEPVVRY